MAAGTLYTYPESFRALKIRVAAAYSGFNLKVVEVNANDKHHEKVPSFETNDKKVELIETNAIAFYVANDQLRGVSVEDRARVLQWLNWGSNDVASAVASWVYPSLSLVESTPQAVAHAKNDLKKIFEFLNKFLQTRTYLVGERLTLADISLAADLLLAYEHVADEAFRKPFANVNRWFTTVTNQTKFKSISGEIKLAVKALEYDAKKHAEHTKHAKETAAKPAKEAAKPAEPKPAKKEEPKKPAPKNDDEEEEDDILAQEPKQTDPFATMPKGNWNMDEFKRVYSNEDTATKALPYFWQHFEKEFYSLWYCEYKYSNELTQCFMSSNLIGGMFQRIEKLRKNAFASMAVFGENNDNLIAGVWFWKGQELAFPLCPDWTTDYETYTWRKMNPDDENDKKLVNDFFLWQGEVKGKKFNCGKIFK
jgi:elongation factor 1-gamma